METFDGVAGEYEEKSLVQHKAAMKLWRMLEAKGTESVLDVGCGPGHITAWIAGETAGRVVGTDVSPDMIEEASALYPGVEFRVVAAEGLDYEAEFDVVYCNSVLQWFKAPGEALGGMFAALKSPGKVAMACPATHEFSPWYSRLVARVVQRPGIAEVFAHWRYPWFHLESTEDYREFFEKSGLETVSIKVDREVDRFPPDRAYGIYESGARQGFTGREFYDVDVGDDYVTAFDRAVREEIEKEAVDGVVTVDFNRLYYVGEKR